MLFLGRATKVKHCQRQLIWRRKYWTGVSSWNDSLDSAFALVRWRVQSRSTLVGNRSRTATCAGCNSAAAPICGFRGWSGSMGHQTVDHA